MSASDAVAVDSPPAVSTKPAFEELVWKEFRATWHGRCRWLWIIGAFAVEALLIGLYAPPINAVRALQGALLGTMGTGWPALMLLGFCVYWPAALVWTGAAALGADLFSLQYRENPEPHRQWPPWEFLARALGRMLPWLGWSAVWLSTWMFLEFWASHVGRISVSKWVPMIALSPMSPWQEAVRMGLTVLVFTPPFASVAALLSATSRRPRRGRLTVATWIVILLLSVGNQLLAFQLSALEFRSGLLYYALLWTAETIAAAGAVWWVARERYRRHPYTVALEANGQQSEARDIQTQLSATTERTVA